MDLTYSTLADEDCFRKVDVIADVESIGNTFVKDWPPLDVRILIVWRRIYRVSQKKRTFRTVLLHRPPNPPASILILRVHKYSDSSSQDMNGGWRIGRSSTVLKVRLFWDTL